VHVARGLVGEHEVCAVPATSKLVAAGTAVSYCVVRPWMADTSKNLGVYELVLASLQGDHRGRPSDLDAR